MANFWEILFGEPEKNYGQPLWEQLNKATQGRGAGGAFGDSADYYRNLLSNNSADQQAFEAPLKRQFQEDIIPQIAENFAGMGSGGLNSSSFRNAGVRAGTDLAERLGSIRAGLRQQGAQGLSNLGMGALQEAPFRPRTSGLIPGLLEGAGSGLGTAAGYALGSPGGGVSNLLGSLSNLFKSPSASPQMNQGQQMAGGGMRTPRYNISS